MVRVASSYTKIGRALSACPFRVIRDRVEPAVSPGTVRCAAESGSELSCGDAAGMTLMTDTVAPVAKPDPRPRSRKPATVSASAPGDFPGARFMRFRTCTGTSACCSAKIEPASHLGQKQIAPRVRTETQG